MSIENIDKLAQDVLFLSRNKLALNLRFMDKPISMLDLQKVPKLNGVAVDFRADTCENNYLKEYAASLPEGSAVRDSIPILLEYFDAKTVEYFHCRYYKLTKNDKFENAAREYLATHKLDAIRTQHILWELVDFYIPGDLIKAQKWCELIRERDGLACELYSNAYLATDISISRS